MSKWLRRRRYDWHLKQVERINTLLNTESYYRGSEIQNLSALRLHHTEAMLRLSQRPAPKPNTKKGQARTL